MDEKDHRIEVIARGQRSMFTRRQVNEIGFNQEEIEHRLRIGRWVQVHHLVYGLLGVRLDDRAQLLAAILAAEPRSWGSHRSAAALIGLPGFAVSKPPHVTVLDYSERVRSPARLHHTLYMPPQHQRLIDGIPCTSVARTLFDLCGSERFGRAERAVDNALSRRLITYPALWTVLNQTAAKGRPGSGPLRRILRSRGSRYIPPASELERRFIELADRYRLPAPRRQVDLGDSDRWIGRVDFLFDPQLIVEVDGAEHHTSHLDRLADAARDGAFRASGRVVLRFTWGDVTRRPALVAELVTLHLAAIPIR